MLGNVLVPPCSILLQIPKPKYFPPLVYVQTFLHLQFVLKAVKAGVIVQLGQRSNFISQLKVHPSHTNQNPAYCCFALEKGDIPPIISPGDGPVGPHVTCIVGLIFLHILPLIDTLLRVCSNFPLAATCACDQSINYFHLISNC